MGFFLGERMASALTNPPPLSTAVVIPFLPSDYESRDTVGQIDLWWHKYIELELSPPTTHDPVITSAIKASQINDLITRITVAIPGLLPTGFLRNKKIKPFWQEARPLLSQKTANFKILSLQCKLLKLLASKAKVRSKIQKTAVELVSDAPSTVPRDVFSRGRDAVTRSRVFDDEEDSEPDSETKTHPSITAAIPEDEPPSIQDRGPVFLGVVGKIDEAKDKDDSIATAVVNLYPDLETQEVLVYQAPPSIPPLSDGTDVPEGTAIESKCTGVHTLEQPTDENHDSSWVSTATVVGLISVGIMAALSGKYESDWMKPTSPFNFTGNSGRA
jgi:hypothetical protein